MVTDGLIDFSFSRSVTMLFSPSSSPIIWFCWCCILLSYTCFFWFFGVFLFPYTSILKIFLYSPFNKFIWNKCLQLKTPRVQRLFFLCYCFFINLAYLEITELMSRTLLILTDLNGEEFNPSTCPAEDIELLDNKCAYPGCLILRLMTWFIKKVFCSQSCSSKIFKVASISVTMVTSKTIFITIVLWFLLMLLWMFINQYDNSSIY